MRQTGYLPRQATSTWPTKILHAGSYPLDSYIFQVSWKSVPGSQSCGAENRFLPLTWPMAHTIACSLLPWSGSINWAYQQQKHIQQKYHNHYYRHHFIYTPFLLLISSTSSSCSSSCSSTVLLIPLIPVYYSQCFLPCSPFSVSRV